MVELRPYQRAGIKKIFEAWNPEKKNLMNVLFQMPTGTGKTTVFSEIVRKADAKNRKTLIVVHRKELVDQIVERLAQFRVEAGVISGSLPTEPNKKVQVATIQTLSRRQYPEADIVIIDECHHSKAGTYKKLWDMYPNARFLGVTATPVRINGDGFDDLFDILIPLGTLSYFIENNFLVPIKHLVCSVPDLSSVKQKMRDYDLQMLRSVMLDNSLMANLVESYQKHIPDKKTIVFAVDVEHSKEIVRRYDEAGVRAAHIDANTPKSDREEILQQFKEGSIRVLSNVDIVSEGFDVPDCEAVQLARPTKSLVLYLQQVGRCMRPASGKNFGYVLDNAGLWLEHGLCYIDREWTLEGRKRKNISGKKKIAAIDNEGVLREVNIPAEVEGLELVELNEDQERLLIFESLLRYVISQEHKLLSAAYRYEEYLVEVEIVPSATELEYCHNRLQKLGNAPKKGFWYHFKNRVKERIENEKFEDDPLF
ncbi:MAG: DEAD/DEAH box helicase [Flavobacteriales bacterium]